VITSGASTTDGDAVTDPDMASSPSATGRTVLVVGLNESLMAGTLRCVHAHGAAGAWHSTTGGVRLCTEPDVQQVRETLKAERGRRIVARLGVKGSQVQILSSRRCRKAR